MIRFLKTMIKSLQRKRHYVLSRSDNGTLEMVDLYSGKVRDADVADVADVACVDILKKEDNNW